MSPNAENILTEALGLPPALRAFVADKLIESLDAADAQPLSANWKKEVRRRCAEVDRSAVNLIDAELAFANNKTGVSARMKKRTRRWAVGSACNPERTYPES